MTTTDNMYYNYWGKQEPKFTEMELALMEGGHSLKQEAVEEKFSFLKNLEKKNESD